jgi:hypothetical protein
MYECMKSCGYCVPSLPLAQLWDAPRDYYYGSSSEGFVPKLPRGPLHLNISGGGADANRGNTYAPEVKEQAGGDGGDGDGARAGTGGSVTIDSIINAAKVHMLVRQSPPAAGSDGVEHAHAGTGAEPRKPATRLDEVSEGKEEREALATGGRATGGDQVGADDDGSNGDDAGRHSDNTNATTDQGGTYASGSQREDGNGAIRAQVTRRKPPGGGGGGGSADDNRSADDHALHGGSTTPPKLSVLELQRHCLTLSKLSAPQQRECLQLASMGLAYDTLQARFSLLIFICCALQSCHAWHYCAIGPTVWACSGPIGLPSECSAPNGVAYRVLSTAVCAMRCASPRFCVCTVSARHVQCQCLTGGHAAIAG